MEPIRRASLVEAAIAEIGDAGTLDVTVGRIAKRAGVSSALAHHYFGNKQGLFLAAMRQILTDYGSSVRLRLSGQSDPRARLEAIIRASFDETNFRDAVIGAWLNFYVQAQTLPEANRLLRIYQRRLKSNLCHDLRRLIGSRADEVAEVLAALIDGIYIRAALGETTGGAAKVLDVLDHMLEAT